MQKELKEAQKKQKAADEQRKKIDYELNKINERLNDTELKLNDLNKKLEENNKEIEKISAEIEKKNDIFDKRIRFIYEQGPASYLKVIFSAENITDLLHRYEIISQLVEYDKEVIGKVCEQKKALEEKKKQNEQTKQFIQQKLDEQQAQQKEYQEKQKESKALYDKLTQDVKAYEQAYNEAKKQEEALKRQAASALKNSSVKFSGEKFLWPLSGYYTITSPYGYRIHPTLKVNKLHTGIDIDAPSGAPVLAANSGTVVLAGYNSGYGNYVIIDHGGGYATLYAHASSLNVSKGQTVKKGQTIMKVGSTGFSTGPHLHFEILVNGSTVNPMSYFN